MDSVLEFCPDAAATLYTDQVYESNRPSLLLDWFRPEDRKVLDVGCGAGAYAKQLGLTGIEVHGITLSEAEHSRVREQMHRVVVANVETWEADYPAGFFDAILFSHVLEHLVNPAAALSRLKKLLRPGGRVYIALPNIMYWKIRWGFLRGKFEYQDCGPLDRRHLRFFTFYSVPALVKEAGFEIDRLEVSGHLPLGFLRRNFPALAKRADRLVLRWFPNFFGYEIYVCASKQ
jgi:SAM-dependent methyltransferase